MFNNIGSKFKTLAKIIFWVLTVASLATAFILLCMDDDLFLVVGLPCLAGPLVAWLLAMIPYAIGEVIDTLHTIAANTGKTVAGDKVGKIQSQIVVNAENERIKKLEVLRAQGLISEEEYSRAVAGKE